MTAVLTSAPTTTTVAARAVDAVKVYGKGPTEVRALDGISIGFEAGRLHRHHGPVGSGKSTLLHCLAGLDALTSGAVFIGDTDLTTLSDKQLTLLRRDRVGFVFQSFNLLPTLTAAENITLPSLWPGDDPTSPGCDTLVTSLGVADRLRHRPSELSGGQQQRVASARAMVTRPELIFADEPTGNLDSKSATELLELTRAAVEGFGQTVVMVTHDPRAASYADRVVFLADGRIVSEIRNPTNGRHPRRAQGARCVSHVQARTEIHAGQEAAAVQHRAVGDARSRVPGGHARVHRHHRPHVRRPVRRHLRRDRLLRASAVRASNSSSGQPARPDARVRRVHDLRGAPVSPMPRRSSAATPRSSAPTVTPSATRDTAPRPSA